MTDLKSNLRQLLGLSPALTPYWDIRDTYGDLVLLRAFFDPLNRTHEPLKSLNKIIIDSSTGRIVAKSHRIEILPLYDPLSVTISPGNPEGLLHVNTIIFKYLNTTDIAPEEVPQNVIANRDFNLSRAKLFLGYEGVTLRIFKYKGEVIVSTPRQIDGSHSLAYKLYQQMSGPAIESLFGSESDYPFCYLFLVVHNDLKTASSTTDNRVLFLGVIKLWDGQGELKIPESIIQQPISVEIANKYAFPWIFAPGKTGIDFELQVEYNSNNQVNEIYFQRPDRNISDERIQGGDFIMLYSLDNNNSTIVYQLEPPGYEYRRQLAVPHLYKEFVETMPFFTLGNPNDLRVQYPIYLEEGLPNKLDSPKDRQKYWWSLLYDAVAPIHKDEVNEFLDRYERDLRDVANFVLEVRPEDILFYDLLRHLNEAVEQGQGETSYDQLFGEILKLLYQQTGTLMYKMIMYVNRFREE